MISYYAVLLMISFNIKIHLAGMTSFLLIAASILGFSSLMPTAAASPSIGDTTTTNATTTIAEDNGGSTTVTTIELPQEPFAIGHYRTMSANATDGTPEEEITIEGTTTITLPNSTGTITTRDTGEATFSLLEGGAAGTVTGHLHMTTEDGSETASADFTEFTTFESPTNIGIVYFSTESADGVLAPLNNTIAVYLNEEQPNQEFRVTFFEWKGGSNYVNGTSLVASSNNNNNSTASATAG